MTREFERRASLLPWYSTNCCGEQCMVQVMALILSRSRCWALCDSILRLAVQTKEFIRVDGSVLLLKE